MSLILSVKNISAVAIGKAGFFRLLCAYKRRNRGFVLVYHRVIKALDEEQVFVQPGMYVTTSTFRLQAAFLKENFQVISLDELMERVKTGRTVGGCCAITLDDGWQDNYSQAFPVLKDCRLPATIFLATGFIGTDRYFWPEELVYYLKHSKVFDSMPSNSAWEGFIKQIPEKESEATRFEHAITNLKIRPRDEREEILSVMRGLSSVYFTKRLLMNWEEAEDMLNSGLINFGAHTAEHVILDQVSLDVARKEILQSKESLEDRLGISPTLFAYPNGHFTSGSQTLLREYGFKAAVTTRKGWFDSFVSMFEVPRIGIHEDVSSTIPLFLGRILFDRF